MAATYTDNGTNTPNGSNLEFTYTFPVIESTDVKVALNGVTQATTKYTVSTSPAKITFNNTSVDNTVQAATGAPETGVTVRVYRETAVGKNTGDEDPKAVFAAGSSVRAADLNSNFEQVLFAAHEKQNQLILAEDIDTGAVTSAKILDNTIVNADVNTSAAIAGTKVSPDFGSQAVVTTGTLAAGATTVTGNITVSGTVDGRDVATDGSKLDGIEAGATGNQTDAEIRAAVEAASDSNVFTDADHSKLNAIEPSATADQDAAEIRTLVESASDSNVFTDADHSKLNAIEASADVTDATNVNAAGAVMNSDTTTAAMQFVVDEDNFASDLATKVPTQQSTKAYIASYGTSTHQPLDNELTTLAGMQSGTASILAGGTALTADLTELNLLDGKSIVTQIAANATDVQIPSAQAVNERITTVVSDVGGFVPIASETAFPTDNPDLNNAAGTIVSIKALGTAITTGSGVTTKTITNGAGSGKNVTITGLTQSTTYPAGRGMLLETTQYSGGGRGGDADEYEYAFHRLTLDETGVAAAQAAIDDYDERYYGALSSAPSTKPGGGSRTNGDMYFDTSANKMKVFNASTSAWDDVATSASSFISTLSPAFDGSETEFTASNVPIDAQSAIISINGVIQKPNSGVNTPSEGYVQLANDKIKFATAPPSGADYFMITLGNAVSIGTPSPNTVGTTELENLAVNNDKIANDTISEVKLDVSNNPTNGQFLQAQSGEGGGLTWAAVPAGVGGSTGVDFNDSVKARFGTGNDLEIYHDGSNSIIHDVGTGNLVIGADNLLLMNAATTEYYIKCITDGSVELYHNNSKKAETDANGLKVTGRLYVTSHINLDDNTSGEVGKLSLGGGNDFQLYHNGSHSVIKNTTGNIYIDPKSSERGVVVIADGGVELYYDNSLKFKTSSGGAHSYGVLSTSNNIEIGNSSDLKFEDNGKALFGAGNDLEIYSTGTNGWVFTPVSGADLYMGANAGEVYIQTGASGNDTGIKVVSDGGVELYYDNSKKFETTSSGIMSRGNLQMEAGHIYQQDNYRLKFGAGDDLELWHDGSNSYIKNVTNSLIFLVGGLSVNNADNSESLAQFYANGAVQLYYDSVKTFETQTNGIAAYGSEGNDAYVYVFADEADDHADQWRIRGWQASQTLSIEYRNSGGSYETSLLCNGDGNTKLFHNNVEKLETTSGGAQINGNLALSGGSGAANSICNANNNSIDICGSEYIYFRTNTTTERARINSNGSLLVSTQSETINSSNFGNYIGGGGIYTARNVTGASTSAQFWGSQGTMAVMGDGDLVNTNNSYGQYSDINLKQDIVDAGSQWDDIKNIKVRKFRFKDNATGPLQIGVVAQEIETVSPGLVSEQFKDSRATEGEKVKSVKYSVLYMKAIKALQEAMAKIETLETKVAALEAK